MIYCLEKAALVEKRIKSFSTMHAYQVAGQYENIEFWLEEVRSSFRAIDEYSSRFKKMNSAEQKWCQLNDVRSYCSYCQGPCDFGARYPSSPKQTSAQELQESRAALDEAIYSLLIRFFREGLASFDDVKRYGMQVGTGIDPSDFEGRASI